MLDCNTIVQQYGDVRWREFAFFTANVQQVLGICEPAVQYELYEMTKRFAATQAAFDLRDFKNYPQFDLGSWADSRPSFLLAFHYGYYRLLPVLLLQQGRKIAVIVSGDALQEHLRYYSTVMQHLWSDRLVFVAAEDGHLFFKLRTRVAQGYDILCYVDGGSGVKGNAQHQTRYLDTILAGAAVSARRGAIDMAYLLGLPIVMLQSEMDPCTQKIQLTLETIAVQAGGATRDYFVTRILRSIYTCLGERLRKHPSQWEAWFYMHHDMRPQSYLDYFQDHYRYIPFQLNGGYFLLDKMHYHIFPLEEMKYAKAWQKFVDYA